MSSIRILAATSQPDNVLLTEPGKHFPGEEVVKEPSRDGIGHYRSKDGGHHRFVLFARGEPVAGLMVDARRKWKGAQSAVVAQSYAVPSTKGSDPLRSLLNYARSQFRRLIEQEPETELEQVRTARVKRQSFLSKDYAAGESAIVVIPVPPQIVHAEGAGWPKDIMDEGGPPHYTIIYAPGPHSDRAKVAIQKAVANVASALTSFKVQMPTGHQEFLTQDRKQKVIHKGADPKSAAKMESIADALEKELRKEGITPRRFPEFIAHATLAKIPVGQSFSQATPEGSFAVSSLELWGWPETIAFPFGAQSGEAAQRLSDALEASEPDAQLDKTGGKLRDLALSTAVGLAGVSAPAKLDMPKTQELAPAVEPPMPEYTVPTKFKTPADRRAHERAQSYFEAIYEVSREVGIAPELLDALVWTESKYTPGAKSGVGAQGLVQMMPATAKDLEERLNLPAVDFSNDRSVLLAGAQYLKYLLGKYKDRPDGLQLALAAYNAGEGNVRKYNYKIPPFKETQDYVQRIMDRMKHTPINIPVEAYGGLADPMVEFLYPHRRAMRIAAKDRLPGSLTDHYEHEVESDKDLITTFFRFGDPSKLVGSRSMIHDPEVELDEEEYAWKPEGRTHQKYEQGISAFYATEVGPDKVVFTPSDAFGRSQLGGFLLDRLLSGDMYVFKAKLARDRQGYPVRGTDGEPLVLKSSITNIERIPHTKIYVQGLNKSIYDMLDPWDLRGHLDHGYAEYFNTDGSVISYDMIENYIDTLASKFTDQKLLDVIAKTKTAWFEQKAEDDQEAHKKTSIKDLAHVRTSVAKTAHRKDRLPGGLADDASPEDFDPDELELGVNTESEHTTDKSLAREIAMDHLTEDPKYYTKLKKFESKASIRITSFVRQSSLS